MHEHHHPVSSTTPQPEPFEDAAQRPRKRRRYGAHERADCIRRWRQSGRPLDALAEEYQVAVSTIHRWIREADRNQQMQGAPLQSPVGDACDLVQLRLDPGGRDHHPIRICTPDGWSIELPTSVPIDLADTIATLRVLLS